MKEIHPDHIDTLEAANLDINALQKRNRSNKAPTLLEMKENTRWSLATQEKRDKKDKGGMRGVFFCLGYSTFWDKPMHKELNTLRDKHGLTWMRISMSYHQRFPNLRDIFQSALTAKMIENAVSLDFKSKPCNCKAPRDQYAIARLRETNVTK
jgi:hypothetical protein